MVLDDVVQQGKRLFTKNLSSCIGQSVYGEQLRTIDGVEYRSWTPYRSKLAAALLKGYQPKKLYSNSKVLYLGAAMGTTVSHVSDIVSGGVVFAVEHSAVAAKQLLDAIKNRNNVIPLYYDANHPDRYAVIVPQVDFLYQDISQRNQADIFARNIQWYLKKDGEAVIMVKARSIDVALLPKKAYTQVADELQGHGLHIKKSFTLAPFDRDHAVFVVNQKNRS